MKQYFNYEYKGIYHKHGTMGIFIYEKTNHKMVSPVIQFSLKKPWWIPKLDKNYFNTIANNNNKKGNGWLAGWLFFYIGYCTCYK